MNYAHLIPLFPLIGFVIVAFFGKRMNNEKLVGGIASTAILASFITAVATFLGLTALPVDQRSFTVKVYEWIATGNFSVNIGYQFDQL
jgi:NADH-quinone oxidoreductase subunit L